jgi:hypothetical protein
MGPYQAFGFSEYFTLEVVRVAIGFYSTATVSINVTEKWKRYIFEAFLKLFEDFF